MSGPDRDDLRSPLLHPVFLVALAVLAVNDHLLKAAFPGLLTGKLSDVAALIVVPPLLAEAARLADRRHWSPARQRAVATVAAVGVALLLVVVKLEPVANAWYATVLGVIQWPAASIVALADGGSLGGPVPTPTVMDPGDLIALPAAALGWWLAAGDRPSSWAHGAARLALLGGAVFVLAATSQSPPSSVTRTEADEIQMLPGDPPVHRRLTVIVSVAAPGESGAAVGNNLRTSLEARMRWPRVEPPARFVISRIDPSGGLLPGDGPVLHLDAAECPPGCVVEVDVAIDWPNADGRPFSSIAWELAVTSRALSGYVQGGIGIEGDVTGPPANGSSAVLLACLAILPFIGLAVGSRRRRPTGSVGVTRPTDWLVVGSTGALVVGLAIVPILVRAESLSPVVPVVRGLAIAGAPVLAGSLAGGLFRWWTGRGDVLAALLLGASLIGLAFGARLIGEASHTFLVRGLQVAAGATILASVAIAGAVTRPNTPDPHATDGPARPFGAGRIAVAGILVAFAIGLTGTVFPVGILVALATYLWWSGSGVMLGIVCFFVGGGLAAGLVVGGPTFFGPRWTAFEAATMIAGGLVSLFGILVAFGAVARYPHRPRPTPPAPASDAIRPAG